MTTSSIEARTTPQVAVNDIGDAEAFLAAIDETIKYFNDGDIVEGIIVKVDRDEVLLDIGYKTEGVIPSRELSIKHDVDPHEVVAVGDSIEALVLLLQDEGLDVLAGLDYLMRVDIVLDGQFPRRDHALGLVADVEQDLVPIDLDDSPLDNVAVVERLDRAIDGCEQFFDGTDVVDCDLRSFGTGFGGGRH